jgi:hypothetical protein
MNSHLPTPTRLDLSDSSKIQDNWNMFKREWEDYEIASELVGKTEKIRIATLRILMGRECARILDNLDLSAERQKKASYIIDELSKYFEPERNVIFERSVFNSTNQLEGERINEYLNRLRQLASTCEFTPSRVHDEAIRDRLVLGISDKQVRKQLIRNRKLTLNEAIEISRSAELIEAEMRKLDLKDNAEAVHFAKGTQHNVHDNQRKQHALARCKFCGKSHEWNKSKCPAYGKTCDKCNGPNHFAIVCRKNQIRAVTESVPIDLEEEDL